MTDAQIEAVARAISPDVMNANPADWGMAEEQDQVRLIARNAITAYEAARPAVATDEELERIYYEASLAATGGHGLVPDQFDQIAAGIRAVRERLAVPELPEWVVEGQWETDGEGVTVMLFGESYWQDEQLYWGKSPAATGPTLAAAIRDAVGEAEREADDA